jgi:hypothetical protein
MTKRTASRHLHPLFTPALLKKRGISRFSGTIFGQDAAAATTVRAASFGTFLRLNKGSTGVTDGDQFSFWFQYRVFVTNRTQQENSSFAQK